MLSLMWPAIWKIAIVLIALHVVGFWLMSRPGPSFEEI